MHYLPLLILIGSFFLPEILRAEPSDLELVAGGGKGGEGVPARQAQLNAPFALGFDRDHNLYFAEMTGQRIGKIDSKGILTIIAGTGRKGSAGDGGPAKQAEFNGIHHLLVLPNGDLLIADTWNNRIRQLNARTGTITNLAGTGTAGFAGDGGPADKAQFGGVYCLALDPQQRNLFVADLDNHRIRKIDLQSRIVTTVAGNGKSGIPKDGTTAIESPLVDPRAIAVDGQNHLYILERGGNAVRVVNQKGIITTLAGTGKAGSTGDNGPAMEATFNGPKHLTVDPHGDLLIVDTENHSIRKIKMQDGTIVRIAGTGKKGNAGIPGPATQGQLFQPHGVFVDDRGDIYIADSSNHRILKFKE